MLMKKLFHYTLALLLVFFLCFGVFSTRAEATSAVGGNCSDTVQWFFDSETGTLSITGIGDMPDYTETNLAPWSYLKDQILTVNIGHGISSVGNYAFLNCTNAKNAQIPRSVIEFGKGSFQGCSSLSEINIPQYVTFIDNSAFRDCSSLKAIELPYRVTRIGKYAFAGCTNLEKITMEENISAIDDNAFHDCTSLKCVVIPKALKEIDVGVFGGCTSLETVIFDGAVSTVGSYAFVNCTSLKTVFYTTSGGCGQIFNDNTYLQKATVYRNYSMASCHVWDEGLVTRYATCNSEGEIKHTCVICKYTSVDTIPMLEHDYSKWISKNGDTHARTCNLCQQPQEADHSWGESTVASQPTCDKAGQEISYCSVCLESKTVDIPATGNHHYGDGLRCNTCGKERTVLAISVQKAPDKTVYDQGATALDVTGGKLLVLLSDGENTVIPLTDQMIEGFDTSSQGKKILIVTYEDKTTVFSIEVKSVLRGWVQENGKWYYYENGAKVKSAWRKDSNGWCYLNDEGLMVTERWVKDSIGWCYVDGSGYMVYNKWVKDSTGWCYVDNNGYMVYNQWVKDSTGWCYVNNSGYMVYNQWVGSGNTWYYIDSNGYMLHNTSQRINGKIYRFNASGLCTNP